MPPAKRKRKRKRGVGPPEDSDARQSELQPMPAGEPASEPAGEAKTGIVCKPSTFSSHADHAMRREWDRQELADLLRDLSKPARKRTCLMKHPGVCHCWHCVPPGPAHVRVQGQTVHYYHSCDVCQDRFRCIPAIPPFWGMPAQQNMACRCLAAKSGATYPLPSVFFCSNLCFWENSPYEY